MGGHQADPFVPMPTGVAVKLCHVKDVDKICWDLLRTGICSYGAHCHWKHPKSEKRVEGRSCLRSPPREENCGEDSARGVILKVFAFVQHIATSWKYQACTTRRFSSLSLLP